MIIKYKYFASAYLLTLIFSFTWYILTINPNFIQGDQWRWMNEVVMPFYKGQKNLFDSVTYEFQLLSHSHIITLAVFLINAKFLHLNLLVDTWIGLISLCLVFMIICRYLYDKYENWDIRAILLVCTIASMLFNFSVRVAYTWSLVTFEYFYLLASVFFLYCYSFLFLQKNIIAYFALLVFIYFFGDAMGIASIASVVCISTVMIMMGNIEKRHGLTLLAFVIILIIVSFLLVKIGHAKHTKVSNESAILYIFEHPFRVMEMIFKGLGRTIINMPLGVKIYGIEIRKPFSLISGLIVAIFSFYLVVIRIKRREIEDLIFPWLLMIFSIMCILGVVRTRLPEYTPDYIFGDRYYRCLVCFGIGFLIMLYDSIRNISRKNWMMLAFNSICVSIIVFNMIIAFYALVYSIKTNEIHFNDWKKAISLYLKHENNEFESLNERCKHEYCRKAIVFMNENHLNMFNK